MLVVSPFEAILFGSCIVVFVLLGIWSARRLRRRAPEATLDNVHRYLRPIVRVLLGCVLLLAVPIAAEVWDDFCQLLPLYVQRFTIVGLWAMILVMIAFLSGFAAAFGQLTRHRQRHLLLVLVVVLNAAILYLGLKNSSVIAGTLEHQSNNDGVILQSSGASCGPAAVANLLRRNGSTATEADVARVMGTTIHGSSAGQMRFALRHYSIDFAMLNGQKNNLRDVRPPAILFVDHPDVGAEGHAVVYFGLREEQFDVCDPLMGNVLWGNDEAQDRWHGNGIECRTNE